MNPYLLPVIESGPVVIGRLVDLIPPAKWDDALNPDRFTVREVIAHLAAWEPISLARIQAAIERDCPTVEAFDEGAMAVEHRYDTSDVHERLRLFTENRRRTAEFLRGLPAASFERKALHPERGELTVADQANALIGHDLYHIEQLSEYLVVKTAATW